MAIEPIFYCLITDTSGNPSPTVFHRREVLLVNKDGREVVGKMRKPCKWPVGYETYQDVEHAIDRARQIFGTEDGQPLPERTYDVVDEQVMVDVIGERGDAVAYAR